MRQTIYIAGPMRGKPDYNRGAFNAAAKYLSEKLGLHPINPVDVERIHPCVDGRGRLDASRLDRLLDVERRFAATADAICLLEGWECSEGARGELLAYLSAHPAETQRVYVERCGACPEGKRGNQKTRRNRETKE